ncbi:aminoglycoside phosphotransferase family protein [Kitasatospora sp. NPDC048239]|uniref:aminoglycoside phosphotransferase family protein n=1 Tax=Kitasatospora sp. NPDC048239 TaxID=3364046 RepID=UPI00371CC3EB
MHTFEIDESLVRSLLHDQHPDLAGLPLRQVAAGWDNRVWRLGDELAVRLPRTTRGPALLRNEQRWLPVLAPRLPLPVPTPVRIGEPSDRFPRPWSIATWVPGEPADRTPISRGDHAADTLAGFLGALHQEAPAGAPVSTHRGIPLQLLAEEFEPRIDELVPGSAAADVRTVWADAVAAPTWQGPSIWLHADLHPANVVVSEGTLFGVIDFGDLCVGDPATDLAAAWLLLPAGAASRFLDAYATVGVAVDPAMVRRARGWAVLRAVGLIAIGRAWDRGLPGGQPTWGAAGRAALDRALAFG